MLIGIGGRTAIAKPTYRASACTALHLVIRLTNMTLGAR